MSLADRDAAQALEQSARANLDALAALEDGAMSPEATALASVAMAGLAISRLLADVAEQLDPVEALAKASRDARRASAGGRG